MLVFRYLIIEYFKVFFLSLLGLLGILFTTRLEMLAKYASFGASGTTLFLFALYQLSYILPIVIPIAALFSSMITFQKLSKSQELTALRSGGQSFTNILAPFLIASAFLALLNFYTVSEIATESHLSTRLLDQSLRSIQPLALLQSKERLAFHNLVIEVDDQTSSKSEANDIVMAYWDSGIQRIQLLLASRLTQKEGDLYADDLTLIRPLPSPDGFDGVAVDQAKWTHLSTSDLAHIFKKQTWDLKNDQLPLRLLWIRSNDLRETLHVAKDQNGPTKELNFYENHFQKTLSEIVRRVALGISPLIFTLFGAVMGIQTKRTSSLKKLIYPGIFTALFLVCYFVAKKTENVALLASALYLIPMLMILLFSLFQLRKISQGREA